MSASTIISLVTALVRLASWLARKADEREWKADGRRQQVLDSLRELEARLKISKEIDDDIEMLGPDHLDDVLGGR